MGRTSIFSDNERYKSGVYSISFKGSDKTYIGSASLSFNARWLKHRVDFKKGHYNPYLYNMHKKYGSPKFKILETCCPSECIELEQLYFDIYQPELNLCPVAGSNKGLKVKHGKKMKLYYDSIRGKKMSTSLTFVERALYGIEETFKIEIKKRLMAVAEKEAEIIAREVSQKIRCKITGETNHFTRTEHVVLEWIINGTKETSNKSMD